MFFIKINKVSLKKGVKILNYPNLLGNNEKLVCEVKKEEKISLHLATLETLRKTWFTLGFKSGAKAGQEVNEDEIKRSYHSIRGCNK